jgi:hypothetical protein
MQPHTVSIDSCDLRGDISPYSKGFAGLVISKFAAEQFEVGTQANMQ